MATLVTCGGREGGEDGEGGRGRVRGMQSTRRPHTYTHTYIHLRLSVSPPSVETNARKPTSVLPGDSSRGEGS